MSGLIFIGFIVVAYCLIAWPSSNRYAKRNRISGADYLFILEARNRPYYNPDILKGRRWWKR